VTGPRDIHISADLLYTINAGPKRRLHPGNRNDQPAQNRVRRPRHALDAPCVSEKEHGHGDEGAHRLDDAMRAKPPVCVSGIPRRHGTQRDEYAPDHVHEGPVQDFQVARILLTRIPDESWVLCEQV